MHIERAKKEKEENLNQIEDYESRFFVFAFNVFNIPRSASYSAYTAPQHGHTNQNVLAHSKYCRFHIDFLYKVLNENENVKKNHIEEISTHSI